MRRSKNIVFGQVGSGEIKTPESVKARGFGFFLVLGPFQADYGPKYPKSRQSASVTLKIALKGNLDVIEGADCAAMGQKPDEMSR